MYCTLFLKKTEHHTVNKFGKDLQEHTNRAPKCHMSMSLEHFQGQ